MLPALLKNRWLPLLSAAGIVYAISVALASHTERKPSQPIALPAQAPAYSNYIGGAGMVEASSNNISIGTALPGIVSTVFVKVGDAVKTGDILFSIDDRSYRADLAIKQANVLKAKAAVTEAQAELADASSQYAHVKDMKDGRSISVEEIEKRRNAESMARARLESATAAVAVAEADVQATQTDIDRLTVRAPITGQVLQVNIRPGEFAASGNLATPLLRLGNMEQLHVRVDIDENDAWRFRPETRATAYLRGNRDLKTELTFVRTEPFVTPKTSLTGSSTERVDTRVLQVIYRFSREQLPAYAGQQVDVFIEVPETKTDRDNAKKATADSGNAP
ncbi:MAG TPA: efflux RND transporter periplasmic adaptor subunit [Pseudomonadales bacterium]|nr:efflux RND transporter periplasmic adaptor subunit [Pseudomonadales bacterium]